MKISILTPSFNSVDHIERAIQSVLGQDYDDREHIVVDGGSTDGTVEILKKYSHLRWISETDRGQADAMNKAFQMSSGDIIGYLNADDEYEINLFGKVIRFFKGYPGTDVLIGNLQMNDGREKILSKPSTRLQTILKYWPCRFPLNSLSYFYRRAVQEKIGKFPIHYHHTMDYWFLLRVYKKYELGYLDIPFGTFHNYNNKSSDRGTVQRSLKHVRNRFLVHHPWEGLKYLKLLYQRRFYQ